MVKRELWSHFGQTTCYEEDDMFNTEALRNDYVANGTATDFNFDFPIFTKNNIIVLQAGLVKLLDTDYTVRSGALPFESLPTSSLPSTGFVRFVVAPPATTDVALIPTQPITQLSDYILEPFPPTRIETDFDKSLMVSRSFAEIFKRTLKFAKKSKKVDEDVDDPVVGKFLRAKNPGPGMDWATPTNSTVALPVAIADGGTGSITAGAARTALVVPGLADENAFTKRLHWAKGADIASAATLVPGVDGNFFHVTGTVTVTAITSAVAGSILGLRFAASLTLTHNGTSLILPTSANIVTVANDTAVFVSEGAGNWRCMVYQRADGSAVAVGGSEISQLSGLGLSNNVIDAINDIDITTGGATSDDTVIANRVQIILATALIKQVDAVWAVGNNMGMRDSADNLTGAKTFHIFVIKRTDTNVVDIFASTNISPTLPTSYTKKRRIGSLLWNGTRWRDFDQVVDFFRLKDPITDLSAVTQTAATPTTRTLTVPTGIRVMANIRIHENAGAALVAARPVGSNDLTPANGASPFSQLSGSASADHAEVWVLTNTSGQIVTDASATITSQFYLATFGWHDLTRKD